VEKAEEKMAMNIETQEKLKELEDRLSAMSRYL